jgi:integrase
VAGRPVVGKIRVQEIVRGDGRRNYTIVQPDGQLYVMPDLFLRQRAGGTDRTYAYLLLDHLRWLEFEGLSLETVSFADLKRYMAAVGAEYSGPFGRPWRTDRSPYRQSTLETLSACLKGFYVFQGLQGVRGDLKTELDARRLPTRADRRRQFLGHVVTDMPANPLAPTRVRRRHPKLPPEGARTQLVAALSEPRDRMAVTWLADGCLRVGELCGLHLSDLHLRDNSSCGECRTAHVHICHREANPNRARAKIKPGWKLEDGVVA